MSFDELLTDTFWLATGKTRSSARRTKRYRQLRSEAAHVPYVTKDEVAEMMLLGEMIADRAFATLPLKLRKLAKLWPDAGHENQVQILRTVMKILGEESETTRTSTRRKRPNVKESLPHQYGKWGQGNLNPNCLGMGQMLIGFARATGAPHMLVDAIRPYDMYTNDYRYVHMHKLLSIIEPYRNNRSINAVANIVTGDRDLTLSYMETYVHTPMSHVLLSIRTDEQWWLVDPYMKVCCRDDDRRHTVERFYHKNIVNTPTRSVVIESHEGLKETNVTCHLNALKDYIPYLGKLNLSRSDWSFNKQGIQLIYYSLVGHNTSDDPDVLDDYELRHIDAALHSVYPPHVYKKMLDEQPSRLKIDDLFVADLKIKVENLDSTKRLRNQAFTRLIKTVIRNTYNRIYDIDIADDASPILREYLHPSMQLAIKTVNQLAVARQVDVPQLIKFGTNQWLIYNMLGSVEKSGNKRLQQILARRIRHFQKNEWAALPQLKPYLTQPPGVNHGKA
jgi:hypothetical protein